MITCIIESLKTEKSNSKKNYSSIFDIQMIRQIAHTM